jgi:two-component system phosphate regulon sensor histidine kinase PhoR
VVEMQEQLRRTRLNTDMTAAMDAFRSERLTNILMQLPFGVLVVDAEGTVSFANRAAAGMLGLAGESLEGQSAERFFDEALRISLLSGPGAHKGGASVAGRWIDHTFKREHADVTLRFWSLPSEFTGQEHILFMQDISQAREAERARDNFLYHITHELRTPLTNIRAYAETLSQGVIEDPQTVRECYNVIMGETQRLNRLIEDILNVSQLEVGSARLNPSEVAVDGLLRKVVQDMQGNADAKHLDLVLSLPAKTPRVRGDRDRLTVVLVNLIGNAIKYTPEGGRVEIGCSSENERLRIDIADTGIGIAPEHQEKIFEKFYRVSDERVQGIPGTGLGLAIVKETVRLHGGNVFVNSTPGKGTTFSLVLPAQPLDGGAPGGIASRQNAPTEKK